MLIIRNLVCVFLPFLWLVFGQGKSLEFLDTLNRDIGKLQDHIKSHPDDADSWRKLGLLLQVKDVRFHEGGGVHQGEALNAFNKALDLSADLFLVIQVNQHKGMLLKMMGRGKESIAAYDIASSKAVSRRDKAAVLYHKAAAMVMIGQVAEGVEAYRQALLLVPDHLYIYLPLVECYKELGTLSKDEWKALVLEIETAVDQWEDGDLDVSDNESAPAVINQEAAAGTESSPIFWALYSACEKAGELDSAWKYLEEAHGLDIQAKGRGANGYDVMAQVEQIKSIFKPGFWMDGIGSMDETPVFIVGMMRSGSTLTETMLDAHSAVWGMGEDSVFNGNLAKFRDGLVPLFSEDAALYKIRQHVEKYSKIIVDKMRDLADTTIGDPEKASQVKRICDKMLFNYRNIGFIHLIFPKAVIIHTMRDPMDTLFSCFKHKFDDTGLEWALDFEQLALQYAVYLEIMQHFRETLPGRVIDIRYEEVVASPEAVMKNVVKKMNLKWEDSILTFYETNRTVQTHSFQQVRQSLYTKSIGSWRRYAKQLKPMIKAMKKHLPRLRELGALPYDDVINWGMDPNFNYSKVYESSRMPTAAPTSLRNIIKTSRGASGGVSYSSGNDNEDASTSATAGSRTAARNLLKKKTTMKKKKKSAPATTISKVSRQPQTQTQKKNSEVKKRGKSPSNSVPSSPAKKSKSSWKSKVPSTTTASNGASSSPLDSSSSYSSASGMKKTAEMACERDGTCPATAGERTKKKNTSSLSSFSTTKSRSKRSSKKTKKRSIKSRRASKKAAATAAAARRLKALTAELDEAVEDIFEEFSAKESEIFASNELKSMANSWPHKSAHTRVDTLVAAGILLAHLRKLSSADEMLAELYALYKMTNLITKRGAKPKNPAWETDRVEEDDGETSPLSRIYIAYGSVLALSGKLDDALELFLELLDMYPRNSEVMTKMAEVLFGANRGEEALEVYDKILAVGKDSSSVRLSKGMLLFNLKRPYSAQKELRQALKKIKNDSMPEAERKASLARIYHAVGKCEKDMGNTDLAMEALLKTLELEPTNREALLDCGSTMMEASKWEESIDYIEKAVTLEPRFKNAYGHRALLYQNMGRPYDAIRDLEKALAIDPTDATCHVLTAVCKHSLGLYEDAAKQFETMLQYHPGHHGWFRKEVAYYYILRANRSFTDFNMDDDLDYRIKEGMTQPTAFKLPTAPEYTTYKTVLASYQPDPKATPLSTVFSDERANYFVKHTAHLSKFIQLDSPGFLPQRRQHRQFGLAVLHMAQSLLEHIASLKRGGSGLAVSDKSASKNQYIGWEAYPEKPDHHKFGWRDMFDLTIRWRQFCEPMDVVYWIDKMPTKQQKYDERVGLSTFLISGYKKVVRYYPYNDWGVNITRDSLATKGFFDGRENFVITTQQQRELAASAKTHKDLHIASGSQPFFLVLPCTSIAFPGRVLNGTRLTLTKSGTEGFDFSICSPSTPERFNQYEEEMDATFKRLEKALLRHFAKRSLSDTLKGKPYTTSTTTGNKKGGGVGAGAGTVADTADAVRRHALELFYYWVNFAPISRGTSATGYSVLYACILALGEELAGRVPPMKQLDWEAMYTPLPEDFVARVSEWISDRRPASLPSELLEYPFMPEKDKKKYFTSTSSPRVGDTFDSIHRVVYAINVPDVIVPE